MLFVGNVLAVEDRELWSNRALYNNRSYYTGSVKCIQENVNFLPIKWPFIGRTLCNNVCWCVHRRWKTHYTNHSHSKSSLRVPTLFNPSCLWQLLHCIMSVSYTHLYHTLSSAQSNGLTWIFRWSDIPIDVYPACIWVACCIHWIRSYRYTSGGREHCVCYTL